MRELAAEVMPALGSGGITRRAFGSRGQASTYHATRLGETALTDATVRRQLGLEDA